jgi:hypothetical protein
MGVFGEACQCRNAWGQQFHIVGVFDEAYLELTPMGRGPGLASEATDYGLPGAVSTEMPVLGVQLSQFPRPPVQGDAVQIRGAWYRVKEVRADGHGSAKLLLNAAF